MNLPQHAWHLHTGYRRLFIVGGDHQYLGWYPVTAPGVFECPPCVEQAITYLRLTQRGNTKAGPAEIREALERFGWEEDWLTDYPKDID